MLLPRDCSTLQTALEIQEPFKTSILTGTLWLFWNVHAPKQLTAACSQMFTLLKELSQIKYQYGEPDVYKRQVECIVNAR